MRTWDVADIYRNWPAIKVLVDDGIDRIVLLRELYAELECRNPDFEGFAGDVFREMTGYPTDQTLTGHRLYNSFWSLLPKLLQDGKVMVVRERSSAAVYRVNPTDARLPEEQLLVNKVSRPQNPRAWPDGVIKSIPQQLQSQLDDSEARTSPKSFEDSEDVEGIDEPKSPWSGYPLDELLIRPQNRTVYEVVRRIKNKKYVMDPDFQRDFIWTKAQQSKLIESVILRIPLPVFYLAEDEQGRMVVVDGLQRLSTFYSFLEDDLVLRNLDRTELNRKRFSDLSPKLQNRVEDCDLIFYTIDSKVPLQAQLDIFERVNAGVPLSRQQMRNCLLMGEGTKFLKLESRSELFQKATGKSLKPDMMRDREFVNRYCAFYLESLDDYRGDMDDFLARALKRMNKMDSHQLANLSKGFRGGLENNFAVFGRHAFRRHTPSQQYRNVLNASLWDVMSTGLSFYSKDQVVERKQRLRDAFYDLLDDEDFDASITKGTSDRKQVKYRFTATRKMLTDRKSVV